MSDAKAERPKPQFLLSITEIGLHQRHKVHVDEGMELLNLFGSGQRRAAPGEADANTLDKAETQRQKKIGRPIEVAEDKDIAPDRAVPTSYPRRRVADGKKQALSTFWSQVAKNHIGLVHKVDKLR